MTESFLAWGQSITKEATNSTLEHRLSDELSAHAPTADDTECSE